MYNHIILTLKELLGIDPATRLQEPNKHNLNSLKDKRAEIYDIDFYDVNDTESSHVVRIERAEGAGDDLIYKFTYEDGSDTTYALWEDATFMVRIPKPAYGVMYEA